jgi:hypothetical protein
VILPIGFLDAEGHMFSAGVRFGKNGDGVIHLSTVAPFAEGDKV